MKDCSHIINFGREIPHTYSVKIMLSLIPKIHFIIIKLSHGYHGGDVDHACDMVMTSTYGVCRSTQISTHCTGCK